MKALLRLVQHRKVTVVAVALACCVSGAASSPAVAAGGPPYIEPGGHVMANYNVQRPYVNFKVVILGARSAKVVSSKGYGYGPNTPYGGQMEVVATAGALTLKHTGPGNIWRGHTTNPRLMKAMVSIRSDITVRACNLAGCMTRVLSFHFAGA